MVSMETEMAQDNDRNVFELLKSMDFETFQSLVEINYPDDDDIPQQADGDAFDDASRPGEKLQFSKIVIDLDRVL